MAEITDKQHVRDFILSIFYHFKYWLVRLYSIVHIYFLSCALCNKLIRLYTWPPIGYGRLCRIVMPFSNGPMELLSSSD